MDTPLSGSDKKAAVLRIAAPCRLARPLEKSARVAADRPGDMRLHARWRMGSVRLKPAELREFAAIGRAPHRRVLKTLEKWCVTQSGAVWSLPVFSCYFLFFRRKTGARRRSLPINMVNTGLCRGFFSSEQRRNNRSLTGPFQVLVRANVPLSRNSIASIFS